MSAKKKAEKVNDLLKQQVFELTNKNWALKARLEKMKEMEMAVEVEVLESRLLRKMPEKREARERREVSVSRLSFRLLSFVSPKLTRLFFLRSGFGSWTLLPSRSINSDNRIGNFRLRLLSFVFLSNLRALLRRVLTSPSFFRSQTKFNLAKLKSHAAELQRSSNEVAGLLGSL